MGDDIWTKENECILCLKKVRWETDKVEHMESAEHQKRQLVHNFYRDEMQRHVTHGVPSQLLESFILKGGAVLGLAQCQEIQQLGVSEQEKATFWTCSTCYAAGATFESADAHLNSLQHISRYMDENEPAEAMRIETASRDASDRFDRYHAAAERIFNETGGTDGLKAPEVLRMQLSTRDGMTKFGIKPQNDVTFKPYEGSETRCFLNCETCNTVVPVHSTGKHTIEKACQAHYQQPHHVRCARIVNVFAEFPPKEVYDEFKTSEPHASLRWIQNDDVQSVDTWSLSQPVGLRYLVRAGNDAMCTVCFSEVDVDDVMGHFRGEFHAMQFVNMVHTASAYRAHQLRGDARREAALKLLVATMTLENDTRRVAREFSHLPAAIRTCLAADVREFAEPPPVIVDEFAASTGKVHVLCHQCTAYIPFDAHTVNTLEKLSDAWQRHVADETHFDAVAFKARVYFDPNLFVPYPSTICGMEMQRVGIWTAQKETLIQTQCDVGLEFMVEDELENEVTCRCCWKTFSKSVPTVIKNHIRSFEHLKQYIFHKVPEYSKMILGPLSETKKRDELLVWLRKNSGHFPRRMPLYSKFKALELSRWSPIAQRVVETSLAVPAASRDALTTLLEIVDEVAGDGVETARMSARSALLAAQMLIINTSRGDEDDEQHHKELRSVVCRCMTCEQLVVANSATWQRDVFEDHVAGDEHHRRASEIKQNIISVFGVCAEKSTYTVKPFIQQDPMKRVLWQWNAATKQHEYVGSIVGLDDIIERRHRTRGGVDGGGGGGVVASDGSDDVFHADFYCQLCAVSFPKRAIALETHVRDFGHCLNYLHQHRPSQARELDELVKNQKEKGKELRKLVSGLLKDVHPTEDYCIRVYDPIGEEERAEHEVIARLQREEKQRRLVEAKKRLEEDKEKARRAQEQRLLEKQERDRLEVEKLRATREKLLEREAQLQAERHARLQLAKANVAAAEAARAQLAPPAAPVAPAHRFTPEDIALGERLAKASQLERLAKEQQIDMQKARLEAERVRLLGQMPPNHPARREPQLVIMPQLKSQPSRVTAVNPYAAPPGPPPGLSRPPDYQAPPIGASSSLSLSRPYSHPRIPPPPPPAQYGYAPNFYPAAPPPAPSTIPPAAVLKRPSLKGRCVDPYIHNTTKIKNRSDLIEYMRRELADPIPDAEIPREFSRDVQDSPNALGITVVAEVICFDDPDLDSYYCTICDEWSAPRAMKNHLATYSHIHNFMIHEYKYYADELNELHDKDLKRSVFRNFVKDLKQKHAGDVLNIRMSTLIDKETIVRLWPSYEEHFRPEAPDAPPGGAWTRSGFREISSGKKGIPLPAPVKAPDTIADDDDEQMMMMEVDRRERKASSKTRGPPADRDDRHRRRGRHSRSRSRSRSRSPDSSSRHRHRRRHSSSRDRRDRRDHRDREHHRRRRAGSSSSRSRSRSRDRSSSKRADFSEQTDSFLSKLKASASAAAAASAATTIPPSTVTPAGPHHYQQPSKYMAQVAALRQDVASGAIQPTPVEHFAPVALAPVAAPPAPIAAREPPPRASQEDEQSRTRSAMTAMILLNELYVQYNGQPPRHEVLKTYRVVGLPVDEGDRHMAKLVEDMQNTRTPTSATSINQSLSSFGIKLNPSTASQQYGISSSATSSQFYQNQPQPQSQPQSRAIPLITLDDNEYNAPRAAAESAPTRREEDNDDEGSEGEYAEVDKIFDEITRAPTTGAGGRRRPEAAVGGEKAPTSSTIPGQRMALARTILPNGSRIGEEATPTPTPPPPPRQTTASPPPTASSLTSSRPSDFHINTSLPPPTIATRSRIDPAVARFLSAQPPLLTEPLGIPAPIAVTRPGGAPQQQQQQQPSQVTGYGQYGIQPTQQQQHQQMYYRQEQPQQYAFSGIHQQQQQHQQYPPSMIAPQQPSYHYPPQQNAAPTAQATPYYTPSRGSIQDDASQYGIGGQHLQYYYDPQ